MMLLLLLLLLLLVLLLLKLATSRWSRIIISRFPAFLDDAAPSAVFSSSAEDIV